ncbi:MAG: sigma-70 family RNA polymerase sigma factor, partial [Planctomycetales bacterium]|nr:sigma-70 family RNA polymerase sigma factor [Planctomycetales bacterium]NIM10235.1 sigma-70 family RNA polymerase sigma factor [Planctomycetales bacterium]NIN09649.1 sigma-70 family RNA polymerase sigma factor [Planctomycetales bacterium]NIN78765.1 sigma-70 family RNA polymerase sigma factor [Planctomycetales bacterium]NIO35946.1 sigma-70 family RNA polymerase sigma factor [Planctomycetales bacterium]
MTGSTCVRTAVPSDEQLLLTYRETADADAFAQLVGRYERELYAYLLNLLGDAQLAEDAFQSTFLQLHLKCDQFQADRSLRPWLYRMAKNQAIDLVRRTRRHRLLSLDERGSRGDAVRSPMGAVLEGRCPDLA